MIQDFSTSIVLTTCAIFFLDVVVRQSLVILMDDFFVDLRLRDPAPLPCLLPGSVTITLVSSLSFGLVLSCRVRRRASHVRVQLRALVPLLD